MGTAAYFWSARQAARPFDDRPIISYMLANPGLYDGRQVTIYGLVIESSVDAGRFLLQDVSQMPLTVRAAGSVISPVRTEAATVSGEHRKIESSRVPERPRKLRGAVRNEFWPIADA